MSGLRERLSNSVFDLCRAGQSADEFADAAILALRQWMEAEGLVCVPREATEEMMWAGETARKAPRGPGSIAQSMESSGLAHHHLELSIYRAMIAAAPAPLGDGP
jgi:hypothetical protein